MKNTFEVEVTPTVTNDEERVNYILEKTNAVYLIVYKVGEVLLQDFEFRKKQRGEHSESLSLKDLIPGIYFVFVKRKRGVRLEK